ncbi:hypothetical protein POM88_032615 [Heracleum sosnowskyi]|uniref:C2H2-type domain-containing protein n=1 Tax=Heracleum sosnowskyi TaxID=360622 RepID=A0AAD8I1N3_9APIA|nr:hypothetical protein POM88_032615 [Heracleum sosnowskyi]
MDYWVAEVKVGELFKVDIPVGKVLQLSHACLGEAQKGHSHIHLYVYNRNSKNVLGSLNPKSLRNLSFNLSFSKSFKLSHSSKEGAVYFHGVLIAGNVQTYSPDSSENAGEGVTNKVVIYASTSWFLLLLSNTDCLVFIGCKYLLIGSVDYFVKNEISKKRVLESPWETTGHVKKPKVATPQNAGGMENDIRVDAPRPSKQDGKTHANGLNQRISMSRGSYPCKQCTRTFKSNISVELHTKAKHA